MIDMILSNNFPNASSNLQWKEFKQSEQRLEGVVNKLCLETGSD